MLGRLPHLFLPHKGGGGLGGGRRVQGAEGAERVQRQAWRTGRRRAQFRRRAWPGAARGGWAEREELRWEETLETLTCWAPSGMARGCHQPGPDLP